MSFEAVLWATSDAPIADVNEFAVLVMLAEKADADGCNTFPSRATIASRTKIDPRTILRCLQRLEERGLIGRGDQRAAEYIRADRRPTVYDLLIPYSWFPNVERINEERQERGRAPLTAKGRPDLVAAPVKKKRSDAGKQRAKLRGDSQSPRAKSPAEPNGVTTSPPRSDYKSGTGCLKDTRTSPLNQSRTLSPIPAVTSDPSASAEAVTEERETSPTDNNNDDPQVPEQRQEQQHDEKPGNTVAEALAHQWRATHGTTPGRRQLAQVAADAADAITDGDTPDWLTDAVVPFMVARRYLDLGRAKTHPSCPPLSRPEIPRPAVGCPAGECDGGGIVYRDPDLLLGPRRCACRTHHATV